MKMGRKVKRTKKIYHYRKRSKLRTVLSVIISVVVLSALVIVGYGVGKPIMEFLRNREQLTSDISSFVPDQTSLPSESLDSSSQDEVPSSSATEPGTAVEEQLILEVPVDIASDATKLDAYLKNAVDDGYTAAVVMLKDEKGYFLYDTNNELAKTASAIAGTRKLSDISAQIKTAGLTAIARINTMQDPLSTTFDKSICIKFTNGVTSWLDTTPEKGGKRWVDPLSAESATFVAGIAKEIAEGGFDSIIYSTFIFPEFISLDYPLIGDKYRASDRHTGLLNILNEGQKAIAETDAQIVVETSAKRIVEGEEDIFRPTDLIPANVIVTYNNAEVGSSYISGENAIALSDKLGERVKQVYTEIGKLAGELKILPCIETEGLTDAEILEIISALQDMGYEKYYLR